MRGPAILQRRLATLLSPEAEPVPHGLCSQRKPIVLMITLLPLVLLPRDRSLRLLGVPNRILISTALGAFCVAVALVLNRLGAILWSGPFQRWPHIWLILLAYFGSCIALA